MFEIAGQERRFLPARSPARLKSRKAESITGTVIIPEPITLDPAAPDLPHQIAALPASGVYALHASAGAPHLSWSASLRRRLSRLLSSSSVADNAMARLRRNIQRVECWPTGSRLETLLVLYQLSKLHYPGEYLRRLRLRMPWFLSLSANDAFPRLLVSNRLPRNGAAFGPFLNRDSAQAYAEQILGLFQIRRCTETLAPDPNHPGCIYGEMNQCLRPCQCAVSAEEYSSEAARVQDFLSTNGKSAVSLLTAARDRACDETDFEQAAQIHKRLERVNEAASLRPNVVTQIAGFHGVALTRASAERRFLLWPMVSGYWQDSIELDFSTKESQASSLDHELRRQLSLALSEPSTFGKRLEHLAIFSRWCFSTWRDGEWFPFRTLADLNYRRLVRQISSMLKTETAM